MPSKTAHRSYDASFGIDGRGGGNERGETPLVFYARWMSVHECPLQSFVRLWVLVPGSCTTQVFTIRVGCESGKGSSVRSFCSGIPFVAFLHPTSMKRLIFRLRCVDSDGSLDRIDLVRGSPSGSYRDHFAHNRWGFDVSSGPIEIFLRKRTWIDRRSEKRRERKVRGVARSSTSALKRKGKNGSRTSHRRP